MPLSARHELLESLVLALCERSTSAFARGDEALCRRHIDAVLEAIDSDLESGRAQAVRTAIQELVADYSAHDLTFFDLRSLCQLLRKRVLYSTDRGRQVSLRLEIASILATRLDRTEDALTELESLLERWPRHLPALHAAENLATRLGRWATLARLLDQHVSAVQGPRTRALALQLAELTPKAVVAIQYLGAVAEARPDDFVTQLRLAR
ncbi:MAG: hypothetical protein KC457_33120, partial [Myxococcales bacterium]|nr:hypothetical protein [Myxococcales bacterium]